MNSLFIARDHFVRIVRFLELSVRLRGAAARALSRVDARSRQETSLLFDWLGKVRALCALSDNSFAKTCATSAVCVCVV